MDLLYFKDDILKDMKFIQKSFNEKYAKSDENLTLKLTKFESKINNLEKKVFELSNKITTDNDLKK